MSKPCKSPTHYNITSGHEFLDYSFSLHPAPVPHKNHLCEILCETNRERVSCFQGEILFFTNIIQLRRASSSNSGPANRSESLAPYFIRLRAMRDREASLAQQSQVTLTPV